MAKSAEDSAGSSGLGIVILCVMVYFIWDWASDSKFRYAMQYNTSNSQVTVQNKPENCDYNFAPIGNKGCHYAKEVEVIMRSHDTKSNRRVISYDEGKTWNWDDADTEPQGTSVYVSWKKVEP